MSQMMVITANKVLKTAESNIDSNIPSVFIVLIVDSWEETFEIRGGTTNLCRCCYHDNKPEKD